MKRYWMIPMAATLALLGACGSDKDEDRTVAALSSPADAAEAAQAAPSGGGKADASAPVAPVAAVSDVKPAAQAGRCTDGADRRVAVVNGTGTVLRELYGSDVRKDDWEEDVLGTSVVQAGGQVNVDFDDGGCGCRFDLKAVFADNSEVVRQDFDICREAQWRITEG